jgi:hypothetical protein
MSELDNARYQVGGRTDSNFSQLTPVPQLFNNGNTRATSPALAKVGREGTGQNGNEVKNLARSLGRMVPCLLPEG